MIKNPLVILLILYIAPISAFAAKEHTDIEIKVTHDEYVRFVGTAVGSSRTYSNNDIANFIFPAVVDLGTLGLESNMPGNCDINVSTLNNFQLLHVDDSSKRLTRYKVVYQSQDFSETANESLTVPCNLAPSTIQFTPTQVLFANLFPTSMIAPGNYRDVVTLVVTTQ